MTDAETQRLEEVFFDAQELPDAEARNRYLDQACAGNPALRAAVEEKLATQASVENFFGDIQSQTIPTEGLRSMATAMAANSDAVSVPPQHEPAGTRIGNYKLLQKIGEGGCGVVYMAEQEQPVRRRVALKIIKLGMDTQSVVARFEAERQALALMNHPNIARVLDGGATETGRPYFVMELVHGVRITEFCDDNNLSTNERLRLFIQVCQAIQHAHQKGIIHRDIKPSNILITHLDGAPLPKVIDFGIAKAIEEKLTDKTLFTMYGQFVGTPAYMSPEQAQASATDVDTRSDIYSLGVLLYELLTGKTPFEQKDLLASGIDSLRKTLSDCEPPRPSTKLASMSAAEQTVTAHRRRVEPLKLCSELRGDLDWIVMRALEKERNRRYETANGMAMDVQRYLAHEPIQARPPSRVYRLRKMMRRNLLICGAGLAVAAAITIGFGTSTWMFFKERKARQEQMILREIADRARQDEATLRRQAEDRERITQAAFLISNNDLKEADKMVDSVTDLQPSLEAESVLRQLGEWNTLQKNWDLAARRFTQLLQADQRDKSGNISTDLLMAGPLQIERGDLIGYEHFRQAAIARFADTTDPTDAERTLKISLLLPADEETIHKLQRLDRLAAESFEKHGVNAGTTSIMAAWRCVSLGLMAYRQNYTPTAKEWCRKCLTYQPKNPARIATAHIIRAMASFKLGEKDDYQYDLAEGRKLIDAQFAAGLETANSGQGFWFDWLFARVLLREAEALDRGPNRAE